jgi:hypothetical protein
MRLDPIYVVAPTPPPPSMPTRRAFLLAGATFTLGAAVGGACGYSVGAAQAAATPPPEEVPASGDHELDELRRLAVKAPIEELIEKRLVFVNCLFADYPSDPILWRGAERLCNAVLEGQEMPQRRMFAVALAQVIEKGDPKLTSHLLHKTQALRLVK